ncbi:MAG: hypothetical protein DME76_01380 [Verrucomicrobia bacterium]|nr:MAG: hypothetical protein DME76_01380 [Verrucomicrobiota bacterium]
MLEIPSFTIGFDDPQFDEVPFACAIAEKLRLHHHEFLHDCLGCRRRECLATACLRRTIRRSISPSDSPAL